MATSKRTALPKQAEEPADFAEVVEEPADFKDEVPPVAAVKREPLVSRCSPLTLGVGSQPLTASRRRIWLPLTA